MRKSFKINPNYQPNSTLLIVILASFLTFSANAAADEISGGPADNPLRTRPALLDGPETSKEALRQRGIDLQLWWTQFYQGLTHGEGDKSWQYGGKGDVIANIDMHKALGLWQGLSLNVHYEQLYGEDVNSQDDGSVIPINTALAFPRLGGHDSDVSLIITQQFDNKSSLSVGKFNMLDSASRVPLMGGGGLDTFQHLGIAAPLSGVTPPYLVGAVATVPADAATFSLMVYDPRNAQETEVLKNWFDEGVTTSLSATMPVTLGGKRGFQGLRGVYSTQEGVDLKDMPQLTLPPELQDDLGAKKGYWYFSYSFQQFLWQSAEDSSKGWGLFGEYAISDGNPNPLGGHYFVGLGGNSPLMGRINDRWGVGYFNYHLGSDLVNAAEADLDVDLESESGIEAFYNVAVTPWFQVTGNIEVVDPFLADKDNGVFAGLRAQVRF